MRMRRVAWLSAIALALLQRATVAQTQHADQQGPGHAEAAQPAAWTFSLSAYAYVLPDESDYVQPTLRLDHDWLHIEARYNYEDRDTTSIWFGYNWSFGEEVTLDLTAMVGGVFGDTNGVAPGYELTLAWKELQLYSEAEYVIDLDDSSERFFYTWSELTYAFTDQFRVGGVIQRTKVYDTDFDIQRGFMAGLTYKELDVTAYVLNPDDDPIFIIGITYDF
jgi:hypothetical protein